VTDNELDEIREDGGLFYCSCNSPKNKKNLAKGGMAGTPAFRQVIDNLYSICFDGI
jgi:hypothetical protein